MYSSRKTEACSEPCQISKMEPSARTAIGFQFLRAYKVQDVSKNAYTCLFTSCVECHCEKTHQSSERCDKVVVPILRGQWKRSKIIKFIEN